MYSDTQKGVNPHSEISAQDPDRNFICTVTDPDPSINKLKNEEKP
jgi:hypothetical protein